MAPQWALCINYTQRRHLLSASETSTATAKSDLHPKKVILSVRDGVNGIIHWEILSSDCIMAADPYCQQLGWIAEKLKGKQDSIFYLIDNARPHAAKSTREKLLKLGWITVPHPSYSHDLTSTDYHLFRSLFNHLRGEKFDGEHDVKIDLISSTSLVNSPRISMNTGCCRCQSAGDES